MAQVGNDDSVEQLPLHGVVLCCTALSQDDRVTLSETATRMGAVFRLDLTCDVTHLIVGNINTPKYRYVAKDRPDIKVVGMDWLIAVRQAYMDGDDVDTNGLAEKHKLGVFYGLKICVTGFADLDRRTFLSDSVEQQGAEYHGDLTKVVTHLIAAAPTGAKYDHAKLWSMKIVSRKWFEDSLRRGMALDESLYDPATPEQKQGHGAVGTVEDKVGLGKRTRDTKSQTTSETGSRKLRRTASTRLHSQSQDMWQDLSTREDAIESLAGDQWKDEGEPKLALHGRLSVERVQVRQSDMSLVENKPIRQGIFSGCFVLIHGFPRDRATRLRDFLQPHGATIVTFVAELDDVSQDPAFRARYLLMPHTFDTSPMEPPELPGDTATVTEWWVERCIHHKKLVDPTNDPLSQPLWHAKIADFAGLSICTTGFSGADFRQTAEAIKLMGAQYADKLLPSVSVLVSGSESVKREKAYYAAKHNISVVSAAWLWECLMKNQKLDYAAFAVRLPAFDGMETVGERSSRSPAPSNRPQSKSDLYMKKPGSAPKRLSNTRHRPATPSLSLQATIPASTRPLHRTGPFVHEDDDDAPEIQDVNLDIHVAPQLKHPRPQPLREISPNLSPRRGGQNQDKADDIAATEDIGTFPSSPPVAFPASPPKSPTSALPQEPPPPPSRPPQDLRADIAALLHHRTLSRSESTEDLAPPPKRKSRPLGRSASGIGNRPAPASAHSSNAGSPGLPLDSTDSAADGFAHFVKEALPPPSTQLGYETADAEAHRVVMEKKMKVSLLDESSGRRVASVGTVKDSFVAGGGGDAGVGNRVRGRNRVRP